MGTGLAEAVGVGIRVEVVEVEVEEEEVVLEKVFVRLTGTTVVRAEDDMVVNWSEEFWAKTR